MKLMNKNKNTSTRIAVPWFSVSWNGGKTNTAYVIPTLTLIALNHILSPYDSGIWQVQNTSSYFPRGKVIITPAAFSCGWKRHKFLFPEALQEVASHLRLIKF